jgi:hypothetical protein
MSVTTIPVRMNQSNTFSSAQEQWAQSDTVARERLLITIGYSTSFAKTGWSKLPYLLKDNLQRRFKKAA